MKEPFPAPARAVHQGALWPLVALAPVPLPWTRSCSFLALAVYEIVVFFIYWRARAGRPVSVSNAVLNTAAVIYAIWFAAEVHFLHTGLVGTATNLLLFTTVAKFASMKSRGEAQTALVLAFLLALDSASSSTHVVSLLYLAAFIFVAFGALARLSLLADFGQEIPPRCLRGFPSTGVAAVSAVSIAAAAIPLFLMLPRLRNPFVHPLEFTGAAGIIESAGRVDLASFAAEKRSNRIILKITSHRGPLPDPLRLRQTTFNHYRDGHWYREAVASLPMLPDGRDVAAIPPSDRALPPSFRPKPLTARSLRMSASVLAPGFLFVPYGAESLSRTPGQMRSYADGTISFLGNSHGIEYEAAYSAAEPVGPGAALPARRGSDVPPAVAALADRVAAGATVPLEIARRLFDYLQHGFTYTLDPPAPQGDPIVDFLLHTHRGHCEYFASALVLMLRAKDVPARLVTGSLGGEIDPITSDVVVRGSDLHAWVEADTGGGGFTMLDPTPVAGRPELVRISLWQRVSQLGDDIEFFYDRNILGFGAFDQATLAGALHHWALRSAGGVRRWARTAARPAAGAGIFLVVLTLLVLARRSYLRRRRTPAALRGYLALRRLFERYVAPLSSSTPSAEVIEGFVRLGPECAAAARGIVEMYRAEAFGGRPVGELQRAQIRRWLLLLKRFVAPALLVMTLANRPVRAQTPPATAARAAAGYQDLRALQARLSESKKKLVRVEKETASLSREVETLNLKLDIATAQRAVIAAQREELSRRGADLARKLVAAESARGESERALRGRVLLMERLGRLGYFRLLIRATDARQFFLGLQALDAMARADGNAVKRFTDASRKFSAELAAQADIQRQTEQLFAQDQEQVARIVRLKARQAGLLVQSQRQASRARTQVAELSEKAAKLEQLLDVLSRGESTLSGSPRPWKGVLDWPIRGPLAVTFGSHRNPRFNTYTVSNGIEILAPDGAPVNAIYAGKVIFARWFADYGNMVVIDHGDGVLSLYAHLRSITVPLGGYVSAGDTVGLVGTEPGQSQPSLYFEIRDRQKAVDPLTWLR